jgi:hypothetical protein
MPSRFELQTILENILGSENVYFQPPASLEIDYPAIIFCLDDISNKFANDGVYYSQNKYMLTVIDHDPDSPIVDKVKILPTCRFVRHFKSENLNHWVFVITY